ncbi:hypothetical protein L3X38_036375 [Prunus dulcis]|uniref:Uncharacterized protein n=1 Tax=Prunus dulcis TaxID=3755 RepID=A0AAD4V1J4_PRUDU|nr:hypothetical protein L3X38_036375 [Prunus dulcis]
MPNQEANRSTQETTHAVAKPRVPTCYEKRSAYLKRTRINRSRSSAATTCSSTSATCSSAIAIFSSASSTCSLAAACLSAATTYLLALAIFSTTSSLVSSVAPSFASSSSTAGLSAIVSPTTHFSGVSISEMGKGLRPLVKRVGEEPAEDKVEEAVVKLRTPVWCRPKALRCLSLAFGSFGRCLAPWKCVFLRHGRRRGCLGASRFDAGSARPRNCVFLRHGRRRGCLGASRFDAGSARFIMV